MNRSRILIVGYRGGSHVGDSFLHAAPDIGVGAQLVDVAAAWSSNRWVNRICWRLQRPPRLNRLNHEIQNALQAERFTTFLTTGITPVTAETVRLARSSGAVCANFSTDDPWNPAHKLKRFLRSIPEYDVIFSARKSNMNDFRAAGAREVRHLPFAYDPRLVMTTETRPKEDLRYDVLFVGGADRDRLPIVLALIRAGLRLRLHGGYWDRHPETRGSTGGIVSPLEISRVTAASAVTLLLVRRANRDGHVMRTFEAAASRACLLVEDTPEHREIFGTDDECVVYFDSTERMVRCAQELVADAPRRRRLAEACYTRIITGRNTYADRLRTIMVFPQNDLPTGGGR